MDTTFNQYKNLLLKLAWSFSISTNKELEELIGEAYLAYCEALESFIPGKSACLSTWIYIYVKNHLISWTQKQPFSLGGEIDFDMLASNVTQSHLNPWMEKRYNTRTEHGINFELLAKSDVPESQFEFLEGLKIMSRDAQSICQLVLDSPTVLQKAEITENLLRQRWSWKRIRGGIKEIRLHLQEV